MNQNLSYYGVIVIIGSFTLIKENSNL